MSQETLSRSWILLGIVALLSASCATPETEAPAEPVNPHADNVVHFDENNSGGSWWLSKADYEALERAGWKMGRRSYDGSIRGASREGLSDEDAIAEWAAVTEQNPHAEGCNCCGQPFNFY